MKKQGFTLIELLVAISIIAVLSVIGLALYQGVQAKARDSVRKSNLQKLALALEIYFQQNNRYVAVVNANNSISDITSCQTDPNPQTNSFYSAIRANMSDGIVPTDPSAPANQNAYCYLSSRGGQSFTLCANLENDSDPERNTLCPTGYDYGVIPY